jgi:hypothetical protein
MDLPRELCNVASGKCPVVPPSTKPSVPLVTPVNEKAMERLKISR